MSTFCRVCRRFPDPFPSEVRQRLNLPDRRTALMATHFPPADTPVDQLNVFRTPAQVRLIFEEFFLFQLGLMLRKRAAIRESKPRTIEVDDRIRESARAHSSVQADGGRRDALKEIVGTCARHSDAPSAASCRRRRKTLWLCSRRSSPWRMGCRCVHGADRDSSRNSISSACENF